MEQTTDRLTALVDTVMGLPHIVSNIVHYARTDRPTLVRLMRTDRSFYVHAAPVLYDTVVVWEKTVESFFCGAESDFTEDDKWYMTQVCDAVDTITLDHTHFPSFENKPPPRKFAESHAHDAAMSSLPFSKRQLLSFVRVLTLGSHRQWSCNKYYLGFLKLTTNVEVLRIVETPIDQAIAVSVCMSNVHPTTLRNCACPIILAINPRKLVVRNLTQGRIPFPPLWCLNSNTKEVVVVVPTGAALLHDHWKECDMPLIQSFRGQFYRATTVKYVLWPDWDYTVTTLSEARRLLAPDFTPSQAAKEISRAQYVDVLAAVLEVCSYTRHPRQWMVEYPTPEDLQPRIEIYGLCSLEPQSLENTQVMNFFKTQDPNVTGLDFHAFLRYVALERVERIDSPSWLTRGKQLCLASASDIELYPIDEYKHAPRNAEISEWD